MNKINNKITDLFDETDRHFVTYLIGFTLVIWSVDNRLHADRTDVTVHIEIVSDKNKFSLELIVL